MESATVTVRMDGKGRVVIPKAAREKLGVNGEETTLEIEVRHDG